MPTSVPRWMTWTLQAAGFYNLAWGLYAVVFPHHFFDWLGMPRPNYPQLWQCIGMIVGVYGVGYLMASSDPFRHWPIVLVGLLGKLFGPIGLAFALWSDELPIVFGITCLFNDLIWWIPFTLILLRTWDAYRAEEQAGQPTFEQALHSVADQRGRTLATLSGERPILLTFLRHFG